jgi:hypothetical protein
MATRNSGTAPINARTANTSEKDYWNRHPYRPGKTARKRNK